VPSVSDASAGMLNACKQHCILCTVSSLCSARLRKRGKLITQEMSESKSLRECRIESRMEAVDQGFLEVPGTNGGLLKKIIREVSRAALIRVPRCAEAGSCDGAWRIQNGAQIR